MKEYKIITNNTFYPIGIIIEVNEHEQNEPYFQEWVNNEWVIEINN